jgi:L-lactate dehydrogenase complex protein LldF
MEGREKIFKTESEKVGFDLKQRKIINHNIGKYTVAVEKGKNYFSSLQNAKDQASNIKDYVVNNLDQLLTRFEKKARKNNMEVLWAEKAQDVIGHVKRIAESQDAKLVVKTKSMVSEELELNKHLKEAGIESLETDLGEFIVQTADEKPYHILTPAMHKSKEDVAKLFNEKFGTNPEATPNELTAYVRKFLREQFMKADIGITGANFLIADTGSVALTENEGNGLMTASWPKTLIIIAGIEKVLPGIEDLELFWPLVSVMGTGQYLTAYNSLISGPKDHPDKDGPEKVFLILFDGGRSRLYDEDDHYEALKCIRCGACLNYCPVYKNIGGFTYNTVYTGPIGSVISKYLDDSQDTGFLNFASSLCGKCTEVCPVKIPLHDLLLLNRSKMVENGESAAAEKLGMKYFKKIMLKRKKLDRISAGMKNFGMNTFGSKLWGKRRSALVFSKKSFSQKMREKQHS